MFHPEQQMFAYQKQQFAWLRIAREVCKIFQGCGIRILKTDLCKPHKFSFLNLPNFYSQDEKTI